MVYIDLNISYLLKYDDVIIVNIISLKHFESLKGVILCQLILMK